jgi:drug/metabolite transporter (DMT)-like permease
MVNAPGPVLAGGSVAVGAILLVPLAAIDFPTRSPSTSVWLSLLGLALIGTVGAQIVYFHILPRHGAGKIAMVAYLIPIVSVVIGAAWLSEAITGEKAGGLVLILGGVALGSGMWTPHARRRSV